ncbi:MAG: metal ABC transporter permease, partial [Bdellovibrionales bacterium]
MMPIDFLITPFTDFAFMKRALAAALILAIGGTPLGVFMSLRRMTLVGDALGHAILPGVAVAFLIAGFSVWAMTLGGVIAALLVALLVLLLTRWTRMKEDSAFTLVYLLSLAAGVTLISMKGSCVNLMQL